MNYKTLIYISLIIGVLTYTFIYAKQNGMHQVLPEPVNRHIKTLGIAVSELRYGLKGYQGYNKVLYTLRSNGITKDPSLLNKYGRTFKEVLKDPVILNNAIKQTLNIEDVASLGRYYLFREDKGLVTYYKMAFRIFGYKIKSFFYLYFLLLIISVIVFLIMFYARVDLLNILLLFTCAHLVVVGAAPRVGIELQTVHNSRFLSVLAILPALYLALVIFGKHRFTKPLLVCTFIQAAILIFIIHIRTSTVYQIMFLSLVFVLASFWFWVHNSRIGKFVFNKIHFWPLVIIYTLFFILKIHLNLSLDYPYTSATESHQFWHAIYLGLAAHPESKSKYGIEHMDSSAYNVARERIIQEYGIEMSFNQEKYDSILRQEFFKILKEDPKFVIESYLYKFPLFVRNYFSSSFAAVNCLFKWPLLMIIIAGGLLGGGIFLRSWPLYLCLFVLGLVFSLFPIFLSFPGLPWIADPAVIFTMVIYLIISGPVCYIIRRFLTPVSKREVSYGRIK